MQGWGWWCGRTCHPCVEWCLTPGVAIGISSAWPQKETFRDRAGDSSASMWHTQGGEFLLKNFSPSKNHGSEMNNLQSPPQRVDYMHWHRCNFLKIFDLKAWKSEIWPSKSPEICQQGISLCTKYVWASWDTCTTLLLEAEMLLRFSSSNFIEDWSS